MNQTTISIPKMDCAAEERLVRMALEGTEGIRRIDVDLNARLAIIIHEGPAQRIEALLKPLNFGAAIRTTTEIALSEQDLTPAPSDEGRTLRIVLAINAAMFAAEMFGAFLADSSALLADSLDMFADATVYGIALYGVHRARTTQLKVAKLSGILQMLLALGAFAEVVRRLIVGSEPEAPIMVMVAVAALAANVTCMWLLTGLQSFVPRWK